ncbi:Apc13p-domain-containing protein [Rhizodiscina lignyota]|uniref:Apc13p-domain-containing protein n=1 Tax=Rhizodiscina lignyota TaxID=1504668 RepID=A0A9P4MGP4_9PEZI|nr:Apc13p-domain-containing protein [Rhizodiscina lignyota]
MVNKFYPGEYVQTNLSYLQSKDSTRSPLHLHAAQHADLFEDFNRTHLAPDEIYVPPQHQPVNPEDEDDVVPDQHAAFGIQRATQKQREPAWRDLGLEELMRRRPQGEGEAIGLVLRAKRTGEALRGHAGGMGVGAGTSGGVGGGRSEGGSQLPR